MTLPPPPCPPIPPKKSDDAPWIPPHGRDAKGRILKGFGGRKPGSRNVRSREALHAVQALTPAATHSLGVLVRQMNFAAIKYVLDTVLPKEGRLIELDSGDPLAVIDALTDGEINPTEFAKIAVGMKSAMDSAELAELKNQVDELETLIGQLKR